MFRFVNVSVSDALALWESYVEPLPRHMGVRKEIGATLGYDDRNDEFNRTYRSRSKDRHSRIRKEGKFNKKRHRKPWHMERFLAELFQDINALVVPDRTSSPTAFRAV